MNLGFLEGIFNGSIIALLKANREEILRILEYAIANKTSDGINELIKYVELLPSNSMFQKFVKWLVLGVLRKNLGQICSLVDMYSLKGAEYIFDMIIKQLGG